MEMKSDFDPTVVDPEEIPLKKNTLTRVLAQVKFPPIISLEKKDFIADFQESIRSEYPELILDNVQGNYVVPAGMPPLPTQTIWRFSSEDRDWRVSLAQDFIALEAMSYSSRKDFLFRFKNLLEAVEKRFQPSSSLRIGVRYVNRDNMVSKKEAAEIFRSNLLGLTATPLAEKIEHYISETSLKLDTGRLHLKWGILPGNATFEPEMYPPRAQLSWFLDLDMFSVEAEKFSSSENILKIESFTKRIYAFFRWVTTESFIEKNRG